jgi:4-amino-4-deoxy-L-arabinose transferase-like glycosyltransferase
VLWLRRREPRTDAIRAGFIMWSSWLVIYGLAYSEGEIHTYYVVTLGPALAAICGAGLVELWRAFRAGGRRAWLLPLAVAANDIWAIYLVDGYPTYRGWLIPVLAVLGIVAVAALLIALLRPAVGRRALVLGGVAGVLALVVAPGAWAASVITSSSGSVMGNVGPSSTSGRGGFAGFGTAATGTTRDGRYAGYGDGAFTGGFSAGSGTRRDGFGGLEATGGGAGAGGGMAAMFGGGSTTLTTQERELLDYAEAHDDGARFTLTVTSWDVASPYILSTGADVLPMGGFTGAAPFPTLAQFEQYVKLGEVRFVVLPAQSATSATGAFGGTSAKSDSTVSQIENWVREGCSTVAASAYGGSASTSTSAGTLYECTHS